MPPKKTKKPSLEKPIQNEILAWLKTQPHCFAWQNNNLPIYDPHSKCYRAFSKYAMRGAADILGMWGDLFLAIEVKVHKRTLTMEQRLFLKEIDARGGIAFVATSLDEVKEQLRDR